MVYWDKGHSMMAFAVYGTGRDFEHALDLAQALLEVEAPDA